MSIEESAVDMWNLQLAGFLYATEEYDPEVIEAAVRRFAIQHPHPELVRWLAVTVNGLVVIRPIFHPRPLAWFPAEEGDGLEVRFCMTWPCSHLEARSCSRDPKAPPQAYSRLYFYQTNWIGEFRLRIYDSEPTEKAALADFERPPDVAEFTKHMLAITMRMSVP